MNRRLKVSRVLRQVVEQLVVGCNVNDGSIGRVILSPKYLHDAATGE